MNRENLSRKFIAVNARFVHCPVRYDQEIACFMQAPPPLHDMHEFSHANNYSDHRVSE